MLIGIMYYSLQKLIDMVESRRLDGRFRFNVVNAAHKNNKT